MVAFTSTIEEIHTIHSFFFSVVADNAFKINDLKRKKRIRILRPPGKGFVNFG